MGKRKIMVKAELREISSVDKPAQEGAMAPIMKRAMLVAKLKPSKGEKEDEFRSRFMSDARMKEEYPDEKQRLAVAGSMYRHRMSKRIVMTSQSAGHAHSIITNRPDGGESLTGETSYSSGERDMPGHTHPWVMDEAGNIYIGDAHGHTHAVAILVMKQDDGQEEDVLAVLKGIVTSTAGNDAAVGGGQDGDHSMTPEEKAAMEKAAQEKLDAMQKRAERAEKLAELTDAQRAVFAKLDDQGKDRFLAMSQDERQAEVAKAADLNPIVYTSPSGEAFRKNDDPRLVALAKRADEERAARLTTEKALRTERLQKQAEELKHLPGSLEERVALLEAIELLPTEKRAPALNALKAQDAGLAKAFETRGHAGSPQPTEGPEAELQTIAKRLRDADPKLTEAQAMVKALETPEGQRAYSQMPVLPA